MRDKYFGNAYFDEVFILFNNFLFEIQFGSVLYINI